VHRAPIDAITERQLSLIASRQFLAAGGSEKALRWAVADSWLRPFRWRGVYEVVGAAASEFRPLLGACLAAGRHAAAAGLGAAWVYGVPDILPGALEIVMFDNDEARLAGVSARRCALPGDGLVTLRHDVPVVVPALCVVQLARSNEYLSKLAGNYLVTRGHTTFSAILKCLDEVDPRGRGSKALREFLLRELEIPGHDDSPAARKLGRALTRAGLPKFETQHRVDTPDGDLFLDFAWPWAKVGLEYNGWLDHGATQNAIERDARRRGRLAALGWRILDATKGSSFAEVIRWTTDALVTTHEPPAEGRLVRIRDL